MQLEAAKTNDKLQGSIDVGEINKTDIKNRLDEIREKFRIISANIYDWEYWIDVNGSCIFITEGCERIAGYKPGEFYADNELFYKIVHPDDYELFIKHITELNEYKQREKYDFRIIGKDSSVLWVRNNCLKVFDSKGNPYGIRGKIKQIKHKEKSQETLRQHIDDLKVLNDLMSEMLQMNDFKSIYEFITLNLQKRYDKTIVLFNSIDEQNKKSCLEAVSGLSSHLFNQAIRISKINPIGKKFNIAKDLIKLFKTNKFVEIKGGLLNFSAGEYPPYATKAIDALLGINKIYTIGITNEESLFACIHFFTLKNKEINDGNFIETFVKQAGIVLQKKQAEIALAESENALKITNATKDKLFSVIAHDLRLPFNGILGFLELLLDKEAGYSDPEKENFIKIIADSSRTTLSLLENLLEWSKIQSGNTGFNPVLHKLGDIVNNVLEQTEINANHKNIQLVSEISEKITVLADSGMLKSILRNLIVNAIKYTNQGGTISVSARQDKKNTTVSVKDNGIGIENEILGKLFDVTEKISTIGTKNEKGSGLGLVLCKEFVVKHGGDIWAESQKGQGSTFIFTLPST